MKIAIAVVALLLMGKTFVASSNGIIGARLVIHSLCQIDKENGSDLNQKAPHIVCSRQWSEQAKVTESVTSSNSAAYKGLRLVTVEW